MTIEEVKNAFFFGTRVKHGGIEYDCISALIYRRKKDGRKGKKDNVVTVELYDSKSRSVVIALPKDVEIVEAEE